MRQLFWKEWYELRMLPPASAACVALLIFAAKAFNKYYDSQPFRLEDTFLPLGATWALFGLLAGAGLIAQEVGSGGLLFLSALPTSRKRLWWVKAVTALGIFLLSILSSALMWACLGAFLLQSEFFHASLWHEPLSLLWAETGLVLLILLVFFAIALGVSPFLDRPISAAVTALLASIAYFTTLQYGVTWYEAHRGSVSLGQNGAPPSHDPLMPFTILTALTIPWFAAVSYWTFTRGETLRSPKRFRVGTVAGSVSLAIIALVLISGNQLRLW